MKIGLNLKKIFFLIFIFLVINTLCYAQDSSFILTSGKVKEYYPTYIGNGHFSISSSQLGTLPVESFMINFYDQAENDIPRIAALPCWNEVNFYSGGNWLNQANFHSQQITNYNQTLNMFDGYLQTEYSWTDSLSRTSDISVQTFISRSNKNLAVIKFEVTTHFSDVVKFSFPIKERNKPKRINLAVLNKIDFGDPNEWPYYWYPGFAAVTSISAVKKEYGGKIIAHAHSEGRQTEVGIVSEIFFDNSSISPDVKVSQSHNSASINFSFRSKVGEKYRFYKFVSIFPESETENFLNNKATNIVEDEKSFGFEYKFENHIKEWNKIWDTDIIIDGDPELQKIVHSMIFYLLCSADANTNFGIPPMGLATSGYFGHIFWDSDIYMVPPLLLMYPEVAKSLIRFRYNTLKSAKENAKMNNFNGAMYPWESDEIGMETTPHFAYKNALRENHIVGDVAFAQWQYYSATKDTNYLKKFGAEIIRETADFWLSRVYNNKGKDRYEIHEVISVSENDMYVNNETYTNSIAKINLDLAIKVSKLLELEINPEWEKVRDKIFIPFNQEEEYHPLHENANVGEGASKFWSSVVNLLAFPLQIEMSDNTKKNDLLHAVNSLELNGAGAMMGINFLSIIAAELGNDSLLNHTISKTLYGYLKPPFYVLSETHNNKSVNFLTGAGSFLQQIIFGYTGFRITDEGIVQKYNPILPNRVKKLTLKNFSINNELCDIVVEENQLKKIIR